MIECNNISLCFDKQEVFKDFNLKIERGESVCISGESGKGKSTLLKVLQGFELVNKGKVMVDGCELNEKNVAQIRKKITWIPQNVNLPVKNSKALLELLELEDQQEKVFSFFKQLGVETENFYKNFDEVSGGQKQRMVIAICLCLDREILFLDEQALRWMNILLPC
ncbi:ATP-binding cassette domain-containing protein [Saccharicrinis fermentans]|uniref:Thiamine import ATP-binding protein ThiQ n=1 Tax=Saccharicrinis fermentans DSM 9555 = JCM 21142 TaxID=869213 RepID=W7Y6N0_9BACT|nr:ATP-binding cassette domain-containing protein [Saccharicrinis fermentans]GAF03892.1 thiamine import ATP-binding protein ThiQ [Saccharicrinis fermentans DSM 9555 = JCM 21142]